MKILGQDAEIFIAMWGNIVAWIRTLLNLNSRTNRAILPNEPAIALASPRHTQDEGQNHHHRYSENTKCVSIARPGGKEQLRVIILKDGVCTVGYNVRHLCPAPYTPAMSGPDAAAILPSDCVILRNKCFSVNYADCTIRWGLYESAKRFVGWPIVPGFDVAGFIEAKGSGVTDVNVGDTVFGCTLFGAYSSRVLVPARQVRRVPDDSSLSLAQASALPTVSLTALYALQLAGFWPEPAKYRNKSILIHSAAGGVGSMLVQMAKILKLGPIVGVVGQTSKVAAAKALGCDTVIDKSKQDLWAAAEDANTANDGLYAAIMDANGVSTLKQSYDHLAPTGRLIVYGFHTNLPTGEMLLSPLEWLRMGKKMLSMPKFDPMELTVDNKAVMGFNLSFFADEEEVVNALFDQICDWLKDNMLRCPNVVVMNMLEVARAHEFIQSGTSIGKIVLQTDA